MTALDAFKILLTEALRLAEKEHGDRKERFARIASSLDLITSLWLPQRYQAGHVLAGLRAQHSDICDLLALFLEEQGVQPLAGARELWEYVARAAYAASKRTDDETRVRRYRNIHRTYRLGAENCDL